MASQLSYEYQALFGHCENSSNILVDIESLVEQCMYIKMEHFGLSWQLQESFKIQQTVEHVLKVN